MSEEPKKDTLDEMKVIYQELQEVTEKRDENKKQTEKLVEASDVTQQIYRETTDILNDLAYYWKGDQANRFLHHAYEDNEQEHRQYMRQIDEKHSFLEQERQTLVTKEEQLLTKQIKMKQEYE